MEAVTRMPIRRVEDLPDYATRGELSDYTQLAVQTLARWAVEGRGPRITRIGAHAVRYRKSDVIAWLESLEAAS